MFDALTGLDSAGSWVNPRAGYLLHITACAAVQSAVVPCPASPLCVFPLLLLHTRLYAPNAATFARSEEKKGGAASSKQQVLCGLCTLEALLCCTETFAVKYPHFRGASCPKKPKRDWLNAGITTNV